MMFECDLLAWSAVRVNYFRQLKQVMKAFRYRNGVDG